MRKYAKFPKEVWAMIERKKYLERLIAKKENGLVKVITGIRRCGKSYLLFNIYKDYLKSIGVEDECIICLALDDDENIKYRNPLELGKYIRSLTSDESKTYYVFLDEIQKVVTIQNPYIEGAEDKIGFVDVVLGLMKHENIDVYVTGSNSKMLSSDILTEFRGRGDEIRVNPLSFEEFYHAYDGDKRDAWQEYYTYGGLPLVIKKKGHEEKADYVKLAEPVEEAIRAYLKARGETDPKAALFCSIANRNSSERMTTRSISRVCKENLVAVGLESDRLTAHSLRHTAATLNLLNGATVEETQQLLGHSNINTTLIYSHALDRARNNSEKRIAKAIFG